MVAHLYSQQLLPYDQMCQYHCDCDTCRFDSTWVLRAQRDSSCSGEVISAPFDNIEDALDVFKALQDGAIETDAEPGPNAGFHVHVSNEHMSGGDMVSALHAYMKWESVLQTIGGGRWRRDRGFNRTVSQSTHGYMRDGLWGDIHDDWTDHHYRQQLDGTTANPADFLDDNVDDVEDLRAYRRGLFDWHYEADRHSNLCINTRHRTWEFRLWNSTRSAWRMELFCRLSMALVQPDVVAFLGDVPVESRDVLTLADAVVGTDDRCAELVLRQGSYMERIAAEGEPVGFALAT